MEKEFNTEATEGTKEELCETLIAISVVAKRLAKKLSENGTAEGDEECGNTTE
ncbi:MAG: hypothetical protein K6F35_12710 [Lachnospiraceae bacterium]|nr:hypothetical protein [Lachnospiraceae bacterium]